MAKQANGSVLVRYGDTVLLVTAVVSAQPREGIDFLPLLVDYEERLYSVGKIPGSFLRREGRPPESAILSARAIDRSIRPLFPKGFTRDIQVVVTVLSVDPDNPSNIAGLIGASMALTLSEIPFAGPVAAVHVGRVDGKFVLNPTLEQSNKSDLDLIVAGTKDAIIMVEAGAQEVEEAVILDAIFFGHDEIKKIVAFQEEIGRNHGRPKIELDTEEPDAEIVDAVKEYATPKLLAALKTSEKLERETKLEGVKEETGEYFREKLGEEEYVLEEKNITEVLETIIKEEVRKM